MAGALAVLWLAWLGQPLQAGQVSSWQVALACSLVVGVVLAYQFPIYIRHNTKLCVISIPLFLMVALLPPPFAGVAVLLAMLASELTVQKKRGTIPGDIATNAGRWVILAVAASFVAHLQWPAPLLSQAPPFLAALLLWVGDLATLPLALCPICAERPTRVVLGALREGGAAEAAQYGVALVGLFLAAHEIWMLGMLLVPAILVYLAFKKEIDDDTMQLLESMADAMDLRDPYLAGHSRRVAELVAGILHEFGMHGQEAHQIVTAARLHDLGKMEIPDQVLLKPGALSEDERTLLETYPNRGADLLCAYPDFSRGIEMIRHHHERWDGKGYPDGLKGTDIPFGARVIAVADSFDAMTNERPHRRSLSPEQAVGLIAEGRCRQWDPQIVDAFLRSIGVQLDVEQSPTLLAEVELPMTAVEGLRA
jgi:hypothetical protein